MNFLHFLALVAAVHAHFTLDYPPARGFDEDLEGTGPCGGFDTVSSNRTALPITGGQYQIDSHHASAVVSLVLSGSGATFSSQAIQQYSLTGLGTFCAQVPDLRRYAPDTNMTLQIVYKSSTEAAPLYQCTDVFLTDATVDAGSSCVNGSGIASSDLKIGRIQLAEQNQTQPSTSGASPSQTAVSGAMAQAEHSLLKTILASGAVVAFAFVVVSP